MTASQRRRPLSRGSVKRLFQKARQAFKFSHSPYSGYRIGAALKLSNGKIYSGTNIENASYGATVCAERVALWKAISENQGVKICEMVVCTEGKEAWPPCGLCRQVIAEFATPDLKIFLANSKAIQEIHLFADLMPNSFTPKNLA